MSSNNIFVQEISKILFTKSIPSSVSLKFGFLLEELRLFSIESYIV